LELSIAGDEGSGTHRGFRDRNVWTTILNKLNHTGHIQKMQYGLFTRVAGFKGPAARRRFETIINITAGGHAGAGEASIVNLSMQQSTNCTRLGH
jgi:hypothetical protein